MGSGKVLGENYTSWAKGAWAMAICGKVNKRRNVQGAKFKRMDVKSVRMEKTGNEKNHVCGGGRDFKARMRNYLTRNN